MKHHLVDYPLMVPHLESEGHKLSALQYSGSSKTDEAMYYSEYVFMMKSLIK